MLRRPGFILAVAVGALAASLSTASAHQQQTDWVAGTDVGINVAHDLFEGFLYNHSHDGTHDYARLEPRVPSSFANPWVALNVACAGVWRGWGAWFRANQQLKALCANSSHVTTGAASSIWEN